MTLEGMPCFLSLSREIRDLIYEYCLVIKGAINPYPTPYEKYSIVEPIDRKLDVALPGINRLILEEAATMLYLYNVWCLTVLHRDPRTPNFDLAKPINSLWHLRFNLIRHLVVEFDVRDFDSLDLLDTACPTWARNLP